MDRVCIVSASNQNVFFEELLDAFEGALTRAGITTEHAVDHFPRLDDGLAYFFVPHEYLPLTEREAHPSPGQLKRSVALCTEQPGTSWFDQAATIAAEAGGVIDINREGARELERRGISTQAVQLGYVPEWDLWGGDETQPRSIDFTFMGGHTPRRGGVLASCAPVLAGRRTEIHLFETSTPHTATSPSFFGGDRKWAHLCSSKVLLNVHRAPLAYLEWQRVLGAIVNGCVVISEHSLGTEPLVAGKHLISASAERIPAVLRGLLDDPDLLASIRRDAYRTLRDEVPIDGEIGVLAEALDRVSRAPIGVSPRGRLQPLPRPRAPEPRIPEPVRLSQHRTEMDHIRMALKHIVLTQADALGKPQRTALGAAPDRLERHGHRYRPEPRVSVVLTVYNYADVVTEAISSVAATEWDRFELVVVDDASTDASLEEVRTAIRNHPWVPTTVVARGRNQGLAAARNLGIEHARGEYVFILDADNAVYPHCLPTLAQALDEDAAAAFAYGILEVFDTGGPRDVMSWLAWDPERLRYGNYIDAMAMIRKSALEAVGGFSGDRRLYGWEDFALWCALADDGLRGRRVPMIVARYRSSIQSMIAITDIDATSTWSALTERYAVLTRTAAS
jgi:Glycosyl transferase family 2